MSRGTRTAATAGWLLALATLVGFGFLGALPNSNAVDGHPATSDMAQVRIFENGEFIGQGTVVAPNWMLTVAHSFQRTDSNAYSLAFGVVKANQDPDDQSNLRHIDRIVLHPTLADVALAHFAQPVPSTIRIPELARAAPPRYSAARFFGWGPEGDVLERLTSFIIDPVASQNAANLRVIFPEFADDFPGGLDPMVVDMHSDPGDSGGGLFNGEDVLIGVNVGAGTYRFINESGNLYGRRFTPAFGQPVWRLRRWINQVISGEGPSDPGPRHDELKRRRLGEAPADAKLPMTMPPQLASPSAPTWPVATLTPETGTKSLVTVVCPTVSAATTTGAAKNICTQEIDGQLNETIGNDDPVRIHIGSGRPVIAWCHTTDTLTAGAKPVPVVRVSFTNTDTAVTNPPPTGYGWYDVNPTQLHVGNAPLDPTTLATC